MKIAVLSDTHASSLKDIPQKILDLLPSVDLIIHAGDFTSMEVLTGLRQLGEVKAVHGNMDSIDLKSALPIKEELQVANKRIGITHGSGAPWGIERRVRMMFSHVDVIIYGHSHIAKNKLIDHTLFFNPGKATRSFGILTIDKGITGEIMSSRG